MRLFLRQVKQTNSIPFPIEYTPNARVTKLLLLPDDQKGYTRVAKASDLLDDLDD
jgi:antitoxin component of RelBE/YafQ-DinJ toxin-antitoxin module